MSSHQSTNGSVKQLDRHQEYFIKGGDLYIVVSHTLFRVHSYFFRRESKVFRDLMDVPVGQFCQGETDATAIMVKNVTVEQFAKFIWVFYNPLYSDYTATLLEWIAILKLAHQYQFPEVKRLAIDELASHDIPTAERIVLYRDHAVDPLYLVPLYVKLCMRDQGPTDDEAMTMGMETSLIIFRARERLRFRPLAGNKPQTNVSPPQADENDITRTIYSLLGFDFNNDASSHSQPTNNRDGRKQNKNTKGRSSSQFRSSGDP